MRKLVASVLVPSLASLVLLACSDAEESDGAALEQSDEAGISNTDAGPGKDGGQGDATPADSGKADASKPDSGVDAGPSCESDNGGCDPNATCEIQASKVVCTCKTGYEGTGKTCTDVDECAPNGGLGDCNVNATCANTEGSRTCTCNTNYTGTGVGNDCARVAPTFAVDTNLSITNTGPRVCADGGDMVSYSVTALTATTATVDSTVGAGCLSAGDQVLLINLRGAPSAAANVGNYEFLSVTAVTGNVVSFASKSKFYGATANQDDAIGTGTGVQRVILQRVPVYGDVVVEANATVTANAWDGLKGGVFALSAVGTVTVNGTIDMSGKGYRGGVRTATASTNGQQGESMFGLGVSSNFASSGGGGGGGGDSVGTCGLSFGLGGAGGGYGTAGGTDRFGCNGGGTIYGTANLTNLFFGSGGGAGGTDNTLGDNPSGGYGGNGGGIVFLQATGAVAGSLSSRGGSGEGDAAGVECLGASTVDCWDYSGPGGGGAGGSIGVSAQAFTGATNVSGGTGGNGYAGAAGDGGNGGSGRVKTF